MSRIVLLMLLFSLFYTNETYSQCCSMGSPSSNSSSVGVLDKNSFRVNLFYRHNFLDTYFEGSNASNQKSFLTNSSYNYSGLIIAYGISDRLTLEIENGYFINKTQNFKIAELELKSRGYGLSNGNLNLKYAFVKNEDKNIEITSGVGIKYPLSIEPLYVDGARLVVDLQPSTNAFGFNFPLIFIKSFTDKGLRLISNNKYEYNFRNSENYRFGSSISNSIMVSKKLSEKFSAIGQLKHDYRFEDYGNSGPAINTGARVLTAMFATSYSFAENWSVSGLFEIPVYHFYTGRQLGLKYAFGFGISKSVISKSVISNQ